MRTPRRQCTQLTVIHLSPTTPGTNHPNRVDTLLVLPLDLDTLLQYELSCRALPHHNHMVGTAQIKIYLSGEANFIQTVQQEFVQSADVSKNGRPLTFAEQVSSRLCRMLRMICIEDMLQSYIAPKGSIVNVRHRKVSECPKLT
jgi:hypothetical protein